MPIYGPTGTGPDMITSPKSNTAVSPYHDKEATKCAGLAPRGVARQGTNVQVTEVVYVLGHNIGHVVCGRYHVIFVIQYMYCPSLAWSGCHVMYPRGKETPRGTTYVCIIVVRG